MLNKQRLAQRKVQARKRKKLVNNNQIQNTLDLVSKYNYDISIIVPIYNAESTLLRTLKSIEDQNTNGVTYEVLLLDDGSTDKSSEIATEYARKYSNFKYFYHNNSGVSVTRNIGIDIAEGIYLMFLDSDDTLQQGTIKGNFDGFEKYKSDADILAYNLFQQKNDKITPHVRNGNFRKNVPVALYNIEESAYLNQCTMNIVIKNRDKNDRLYFDENLKQSEDAQFITRVLMGKGNLIFSKIGGYIYDISNYSTVDKYKSPVNIKNMIFVFFESLITASKLQNNGLVIPYVQSMILYELNWRFKQNTLFPYHLNEKDFEEWIARLRKVFEEIETETILSQTGMEFYHKAYFITNFKELPNIANNSYGLEVFSAGSKIVNIQSVTLVFNNIRPNKNTITFRGFLKFPFATLFNEIELYIKYNGELNEVKLTDSPASYYKAKEPVAKFYDFDIELPKEQYGKYEWIVKIDGFEKITSGYFENEVIFKRHISSPYVVLEKSVLSYEMVPFKVEILDKSKSERQEIINEQLSLMEKAGQTNLVKFKKYCKILNLMIKNKSIWLYSDRVGIIDNAYNQFLNDVQKKDKVKRFYVVHKGDETLINLPKSQVVQYGSLKHKLLYYYSKVILTSFKERFEYSPLSNIAENTFYSELEREVVYLQHGILNAHTPWLYGKYKTKFDKFVVSTHFEKENLMKNYGYLEKDIIEGGMARLDGILPTDKKKKILFAPSWRKSLVIEEGNSERSINKEMLETSEFYKGLQSVLTSSRLNDELLKYGYVMDVKLHPILTDGDSLFSNTQSEMKLLNSQSEFNQNEYQLFITDFSSYVFDFIKNKTKIAIFQPDREYFLTGNHIYNKLDMDLEVFGEIFDTADKIIDFIIEGLTNEFPITADMSVMYDDFYSFSTNQSCAEQVYDNLVNYFKK